MDLFEYQARDLFEKHGVPVLAGLVADTPEQARAAAEKLGGRVVVNDDAVRGLQITPEQLREVAERHYPLRRPAWLALT